MTFSLLCIIKYDNINVHTKNMNTYLEKLFEKYNLSDKDRHEVRQIYSLLPTDKQRNLIANFDILAFKLKQIEEEINSEREILLGYAEQNLLDTIELIRSKKDLKSPQKQIEALKNEI